MMVTRKAHDTPIVMCTTCGRAYDSAVMSEGNICPAYGCCDGKLKEYEPEGAIMANALDQKGLEVVSFHIGSVHDPDCDIGITFRDHYTLPKAKLPKGFEVIQTGGPNFKPDSPIYIYKTYEDVDSKIDLLLELESDKAHLFRWLNGMLVRC